MSDPKLAEAVGNLRNAIPRGEREVPLRIIGDDVRFIADLRLVLDALTEREAAPPPAAELVGEDALVALAQKVMDEHPSSFCDDRHTTAVRAIARAVLARVQASAAPTLHPMSDRIPTEADRYVVVAARTRPEPRALFPDDSWVLVDLRTDTVLGWDGGEPEDQLLVRDWSWVPDLLNRLDREQVQAIASARAEREGEPVSARGIHGSLPLPSRWETPKDLRYKGLIVRDVQSGAVRRWSGRETPPFLLSGPVLPPRWKGDPPIREYRGGPPEWTKGWGAADPAACTEWEPCDGAGYPLLADRRKP